MGLTKKMGFIPIRHCACGVSRRGRIQQILLNLGDQKRQIGLGKAQARRRQTMVFDVGRNMLVMRLCAGKRGVIGMRLRVKSAAGQ